MKLVCRDGGDAVARGFGRHFLSAAFCDIDRRCDGICTFSLNPHCVACRLGHGCPSPDSFEVTCFEQYEFPCASAFPTLAISVRAGKPARARRRHLVLTCRPARDCASSTTTTTLQGFPDLTGDWTITNMTVADDCPPAVGARFATPTNAVRLAQEGMQLRGCMDAQAFHEAGTVSGSSFDLDTGSHMEIVLPGSFDYDFSRHLSGTLPAMDGQLAVVQQWSFTPGLEAPPGAVACTRTVTGVMTPVGPPCTTDLECIERDACARCVSRACRWRADCRYDPTR
jgi:hypothetical protein